MLNRWLGLRPARGWVACDRAWARGWLDLRRAARSELARTRALATAHLEQVGACSI